MHYERNIGTPERWARVLAGGLAILAGLILLLMAVSFLLEAAAVALVLIGFDSMLTGVTGYCPIYGLLDTSSAGAHHNSVGT